MIYKTSKLYKRHRKDWLSKLHDNHVEVVHQETWWLLIIPLYSRETILKHNM